jgi:uncharacterized damage-inducible protein DinB
VIQSIESFVRYFEGVCRRAVRDVRMLPVEAEAWKPSTGAGEGGWSIAQIVEHMAASRLFFATAYRGQGWIANPWPGPTRTREDWQGALQSSAEEVRDQLASTPDEWLWRKVEPMDPKDHPASGWRLLMMMTEHDIHHRSQIDTYAGLMGWPVAQIYGRTAEEVGLAAQRRKP